MRRVEQVRWHNRVDAPADRFVDRFGDIERFERGPGIPQIVYPLAARPSGVSHVIAIKQLYASHYFHTTLELRFLVGDDRRADRRGFYLLSITRSRSDGTTGLKGSLLRPVISRRSRNAVRGYLEHLKRQVERADLAATLASAFEARVPIR